MRGKIPIKRKLFSVLKSKILQVFSRMILGGVFIYASLDKIADLQGFVRNVEDYKFLPGFMVGGVARMLPWIELILGICLIVGLFLRFSAVVLSSLLMVFMIAIGIKALNGTIEDCGCFPASSIFSSSDVIFLILRDALLLLFGVIIILSSRMKRLNRTISPKG